MRLGLAVFSSERRDIYCPTSGKLALPAKLSGGFRSRWSYNRCFRRRARRSNFRSTGSDVDSTYPFVGIPGSSCSAKRYGRIDSYLRREVWMNSDPNEFRREILSVFLLLYHFLRFWDQARADESPPLPPRELRLFVFLPFFRYLGIPRSQVRD